MVRDTFLASSKKEAQRIQKQRAKNRQKAEVGNELKAHRHSNNGGVLVISLKSLRYKKNHQQKSRYRRPSKGRKKSRQSYSLRRIKPT